MNRTMLAAVAGAALLLPASAFAQGDKDRNDPSELVCKSQKKTGTRFATKTCYTRKQWDDLTEANKRNYAEMRDRRTIDTTRDN
ncbi:hypothetical protein ACWPM1_11715 [Tsuneonella sp. HG249]